MNLLSAILTVWASLCNTHFSPRYHMPRLLNILAQCRQNNNPENWTVCPSRWGKKTENNIRHWKTRLPENNILCFSSPLISSSFQIPSVFITHSSSSSNRTVWPLSNHRNELPSFLLLRFNHYLNLSLLLALETMSAGHCLSCHYPPSSYIWRHKSPDYVLHMTQSKLASSSKGRVVYGKWKLCCWVSSHKVKLSTPLENNAMRLSMQLSSLPLQKRNCKRRCLFGLLSPLSTEIIKLF